MQYLEKTVTKHNTISCILKALQHISQTDQLFSENSITHTDTFMCIYTPKFCIIPLLSSGPLPPSPLFWHLGSGQNDSAHAHSHFSLLSPLSLLPPLLFLTLGVISKNKPMTKRNRARLNLTFQLKFALSHQNIKKNSQNWEENFDLIVSISTRTNTLEIYW